MKNDYKYIQFIRNPADKDIVSKSSEISYVAFDYFDYILVKDTNSLKDCILAQNQISCEAYQSISVFKNNILVEDEFSHREYCNVSEGDPFRQSEVDNGSFIALLQVTITPTKYQICESEFDLKHLEESERQLEKCICDTAQCCGCNEGKIKLKYRIYRSVNTMDFCIALSSNVLEFALYLSENIHALFIPKAVKYMVYTVMGVKKDFKAGGENKILDKSVLIARLKLNRNFWGCVETTKELKQLKVADIFHAKVKDSNTRALIGRYDLSVRIDNIGVIQPLLEKLIYYKIHGKLSSEHKGRTDALVDWLLENGYVEYCNERILIGCENGFPYWEEMTLNEIDVFTKPDYHEEMDEVEAAYKRVKAQIDQSGLSSHIEEYMQKLNNIILICNGLYPNYDTQINISMFKEYIISLINLLELWFKAVGNKKDKWNDIIINVTEGLNYLQQFIKIVTSINSSSFQAPVYDIVQKECSIAKFPIAYSQFLNKLFAKYYQHRSDLRDKHGDDEFEYFPHYRALMIPFMQKVESNFFMLTLFSQGISNDWDMEKELWKNYNQHGKIPMFVVCKNLSYYIDVPAVIISSFHEIGHYCNSTTRKMRNGVLLDICAVILAREITLAYCSIRNIDISVQLQLTEESTQTVMFGKIIADCLKKEMKQQLNSVLDAPGSVFIEKMLFIAHQLLKPIPAYVGKEHFDDKYKNYAERNVKFQFLSAEKANFKGEYTAENYKNYLQIVFKELLEIVVQKEKLIKETLSSKPLEGKKIKELAKEILNFVESSAKNIDFFLESFSTQEDELRELHASIGSHFQTLTACDEKIKNELRQCINIVNYIAETVQEWMLLSKYQDVYVPGFSSIDPSRKKAWIYEVGLEAKDQLFNKRTPLITTLEADLRNKLYLTNSVTIQKLTERLYEACMKVEINTDVVDAWNQLYFESMADVVMCMNLQLTIPQYIMEMFQGKLNYNMHYIKRVILVVNFLFLVERGGTRITFAQFIERLSGLREDPILVKLDSWNEIYVSLRRYADIVDDAAYSVILRSFISNKEKYCFVDETMREQMHFIYHFLNNGRVSDEETEEGEIQFVLENYYQNRSEYAKRERRHDPGSMVGENKETEKKEG